QGAQTADPSCRCRPASAGQCADAARCGTARSAGPGASRADSGTAGAAIEAAGQVRVIGVRQVVVRWLEDRAVRDLGSRPLTRIDLAGRWMYTGWILVAGAVEVGGRRAVGQLGAIRPLRIERVASVGQSPGSRTAGSPRTGSTGPASATRSTRPTRSTGSTGGDATRSG